MQAMKDHDTSRETPRKKRTSVVNMGLLTNLYYNSSLAPKASFVGGYPNQEIGCTFLFQFVKIGIWSHLIQRGCTKKII